jgi:hypothetical protein
MTEIDGGRTSRTRRPTTGDGPKLSAPAVTRRTALAAASGLLSACHSLRDNKGPSIEFTRIPQADPNGREKHDIIEGLVKGGRTGQQLVLYSRSGRWWAQPLASNPFTTLRTNFHWSNATHLGTEYAALLVEPGFRPAPVLDSLPARGADVAAVAFVAGQKNPPSRTIPFSGYEWRVRDAPSSRGGNNQYDSSNAWTEPDGAMHLRIAKAGDDWTCAEVSLTRNLGYGTYRFVVRDISKLPPGAVFGMFTWDYAGGSEGNREMDIEISQWGDSASKNAQYVLQPYYVAANVVRFTAPAGKLTYSFRWEQGRITFSTARGSGTDAAAPAVAEHVFTSGIPTPGIESVRMNLYIFRNSQSFHEATEVVIEQFEYLP